MMITLSQKPREHLGPAVDGVDSCGLAFQVPKPARPDKKIFGGARKGVRTLFARADPKKHLGSFWTKRVLTPFPARG
jgi:hypothetical protein